MGKKRGLSGPRMDDLAWKEIELNDGAFDDKEGGIAYCLEELDGNAYEQYLASFKASTESSTEPQEPSKKKKKVDEVLSTDVEVFQEKKKKKKNKKDTAKKQMQKQQESNEEKDSSSRADVATVDMAKRKKAFASVKDWNQTELHEAILLNLARIQYRTPTPVQSQTLQHAVRRMKDVVIAAETGSGKTLAFSIPVVNFLLRQREKHRSDAVEGDATGRNSHLRALVMSPTRELAVQVADEIKKICEGTGIHVVTVVGGLSSLKQERLLSKGPEIVVATPGRLWDLMRTGNDHLKDLSQLHFLIIDEADRMVDDGHFQEMIDILKALPKKDALQKSRQTFVCSATMSVVRQFLKKTKKPPKTSFEKMLKTVEFQRQVQFVDLTSTASNVPVLTTSTAATSDLVRDETVKVASTIEVRKALCLPEEKDTFLYYLLHTKVDKKTLVFVNAISALRRLKSIFSLLEVPVFGLHSNMQQRQRLKNLDGFRKARNFVTSGDCECSVQLATLIATDVAARGIDVPDVDYVVHYQVPRDLKTYVHRTGRCGRAGRKGWTCLLVSPQEQTQLQQIQRSSGVVADETIDSTLLPKLAQRVRLATALDKELNKASKDAGIALDDHLLREIEGGEDSDEDLIATRAQQRESARVTELREELNEALGSRIIPKGESAMYYSNSQRLQSMMGHAPSRDGRRKGNSKKRRR